MAGISPNGSVRGHRTVAENAYVEIKGFANIAVTARGANRD
jgi:hypothetical protein